MTTEAQVTANRLNAQKSTGPRTPEGKAISARNAIKHGLLGEQIVVEGEDRLHFAFHRDQMMRYLAPIGEVELTLADRLVGLSWRLQRVERLQVQAFEVLCAKALEAPADELADDKLALGRIIVKDFAETRILDKLLVYERRIEHSFCRILQEVRREHLYQNVEARTMDDGNPQVLLERFMLKEGPPFPGAVLHMEPGIARWEAPEEGPTVKKQVSSEQAEDPEELWEKVVSGESVRAGPRPCPSGRRPRGAAPTQFISQNSAEETPCGVTTNVPLIPELLRQTKPIAREVNERQVPDNKGVSNASLEDRLQETKPIPVVSEARDGVVAPSGAAEGPAAVTAGR